MRKRGNLNRDQLSRLFTRYVVKKFRRQARVVEDPSPRAPDTRSRIIEDIGAMTTLPSLPQVYDRILELSRDPESDLREWIKAIQVDPMTSAVIIRHANSLSYGFRSRITEIDRAVILLGKETVTGLVASEAMRQTFTAIQEQGFLLEDFWLHSLAVGFAAHILAFPLDEESAEPEERFAGLALSDETIQVLRKIDLPRRLKLDYTRENPFVGGIMHDIGKGVMVQSYPGLFPLLLAGLKESGWNLPMASVEQEIAGGLTHPMVGEILAQKWGLEEEICQVILHHHNPDIDNTFPFLVGIADIVGQALYPFPREARYPIGQALEEGDPGRTAQFLPAGFSDNPLVSLEEFATLAWVIAPRVRDLTEKMCHSMQ